jgi:ABC-2 type transport system permease protein
MPWAVLYITLVLLGLLGMSGTLVTTVKNLSLWSPVGAVMTVLSAGMNNLSNWSSQDTYSLLCCLGYAAVFTIIGVRWFRWTAQ